MISSMSEAILLKKQMQHVLKSLITTDKTMVKGSYVAETVVNYRLQSLEGNMSFIQ